MLLATGSDGLTIDDVNPVWLKTPAAPVVGSLMEKAPIDVEKIFAAFQTLQERVEHVIVEGTGGWLVPIRPDYFVSDLAAAMKLPVLVVAQNRLGCLNHAALTVAQCCRIRAAVHRSCIEQRRSGERYSGVNERRYSQADSQCSVACWIRGKPDGTPGGLATYARVD
jgi:dethiobiotin synthetase